MKDFPGRFSPPRLGIEREQCFLLIADNDKTWKNLVLEKDFPMSAPSELVGKEQKTIWVPSGLLCSGDNLLFRHFSS